MESKSLLSGVRLNTRLPSKRITREPFYSSLSPTTISFARSYKHIGCYKLGSSRVSQRNSIRCDNGGVDLDSEECIGTKLLRKKLAVFVSGGGSNFRSIHEACVRGSVRGDVVALVTNNRECGGAEFAREKGIPVIVFPKKKLESDGLSPTKLVESLRQFEVDFVLLAGYLKLIPVELVRSYPKSVLNIHPSLLPVFGGKGYYGKEVHKAVIASGARFSGATIHFVDEHYDMGKILAQKVITVLSTDTPEDLADRVLREEHRLYVEVVEALCDERIMWRNDGVPLIQDKENPNQYR